MRIIFPDFFILFGNSVSLESGDSFIMDIAVLNGL